MGVFGQAGSGVTLLSSGAHTPTVCLAGHGEQPLPHAHSSPPTASSLQSQGKPPIQGDHLGPIPAAVGSPIPVLQPQHPLGSSPPPQSRTWAELMVWCSPWDATESAAFHQKPPPQSLVGRFGLPTPWRGAKPLSEQPGWLRDRLLRDCPGSRAEQEGEPAPGWATRELTWGRVPAAECLRRTSHRRKAPKFLPLLLHNLCLLPAEALPALPAFPSWQSFST